MTRLSVQSILSKSFYYYSMTDDIVQVNSCKRRKLWEKFGIDSIQNIGITTLV